MRIDVQKIFKETPKEKQTMMFSATLPMEARRICAKFLNDVCPIDSCLFTLFPPFSKGYNIINTIAELLYNIIITDCLGELSLLLLLLPLLYTKLLLHYYYNININTIIITCMCTPLSIYLSSHIELSYKIWQA